MGYGFLESVYHNCLLIELKKHNLHLETEKPITVYYEDELVGEFRADIIVQDTVVIELNSVAQLVQAHEVQLVNYLMATGKPVGLLLNFGPTTVNVRRKVRTL